ncbi:MAG: TetR/AcrR family transcriptional regulator [Chloroflexota bacterium]|nr:MAG: TetR/AcrR family transcriptional regulator [Chloroflexota bacterium]
MPRHKEEEKREIMSETRSLLLQAATEEFAREGYQGANINRISRNAGFAKGTVYNYFDSKRALMLDLIEEIASGHMEFMSQQVLQKDDPARRLEQFFAAGFAWVTDNLSRGLVLFTTLNSHDMEFKTRMYEAYLPMFNLVGQDILAAGIEQGIFRQVEPVSTAALIMNIYLGTGSQVNERGEQWFPAKQVSDFCLQALRA